MEKWKQRVYDLWQNQIVWILAFIYVKFLLLKRRQMVFVRRVEKEVVWTLARI